MLASARKVIGKWTVDGWTGWLDSVILASFEWRRGELAWNRGSNAGKEMF